MTLDLFRFTVKACNVNPNQNNNNELHEERKRPADVSAHFARCYQVEINQANARPITDHMRQQIKWKPPKAGEYKANFDGAIDTRSKTGGIGVIIRDHAG
ncbi:hypothetical protein REPUB_Repub10bG0071400 [Reevesia pubescens]